MIYRQGDVVLRTVLVPTRETGRKVRKVTLAKGEKTGHSHVLEADEPKTTKIELIKRGKTLFLRTDGPTTLKHQEHAAHSVAPGMYRVHTQRELAASGRDSRPVLD